MAAMRPSLWARRQRRPEQTELLRRHQLRACPTGAVRGIVGSLHHAELGDVGSEIAAGSRPAAAALAVLHHDLQLPHRVKVTTPSVIRCTRRCCCCCGNMCICSGLSSPHAAALMAVAAAASSAAANQTIFGQDVQMPCPATTTSEDGRSGGGGEGAAADVRSGRGGRRSPPPPLALGAPPAPARSLKDSGFVEVQQFTKVWI